MMKVVVTMDGAAEFFEPKYRNPLSKGTVTISDTIIGEIDEDEVKQAIIDEQPLEKVTVTFNLGLTGRLKWEDIPVRVIAPIDNGTLWDRATA